MAVALIAGSRNAEEALLKAHLTSAPTGWASLRCSAGSSAIAVTGFAWTLAGYLNLLLGSGNSFLETERQIVAKIFSPGVCSAAAGAAKKFAKDITENVFETCREIKSAGKRTAITESGVTELVILRAFLRIG
jgi:hypothetical protein